MVKVDRRRIVGNRTKLAKLLSHLKIDNHELHAFFVLPWMRWPMRRKKLTFLRQRRIRRPTALWLTARATTGSCYCCPATRNRPSAGCFS